VNRCVKMGEFVGKTFAKIEISENKEEIIFTTDDQKKYKMYHDQDCCETVEVDDICGEIENIMGFPIVTAEEETNSDTPRDEYSESFTWTFYKFATEKGYVTIKWYGESNGYYSESVEIVEIA
jgi:hypothetical protein